MGATIATLVDLDWNPISPYKWLDHKGTEWTYIKGAAYINLLEAIKQRANEKLWLEAAKHRNGLGLSTGADLTVAHRHIRSLHKKGENGAVGMLTLIMAGGCWPHVCSIKGTVG